jgi:hypothetical protein
MRDLNTLTKHPVAAKLVDILCKKTQNSNPMFFDILISYYLTKITAMMRVKIATQDRGDIPVNLYAINLAPSGQGKGHSTNIIEDHVINQFKSTFFNETYPLVVDQNLAKLAATRAYINGEDIDTVEQAVTKEFQELGVLAFSFDSGTTAAIKQMRHKLLMCDIGSMNLEIDEIGSNLLGNADALNTFLELFDVGKVKQKLTKNTKENTRNEEIEGKTPTNLLLFGTPSKLLNGSRVEDEFFSFLEAGYARRCVFGYTKLTEKDTTLTAEQIYDSLTDPDIDQYLKDMSIRLGKLANILNYDKTITMSKDVSIEVIRYRLHCEQIANSMDDHEEAAKAEMSHRYFKALKLAGTYAFIDGMAYISEDNLYHAIYLVENSGKAFQNILRRDKAYAKLAKYIAGVGHELTHVDLTENLPFYKGSVTQKNDLMQLAIAWGYKHSMIIKRTMSNNIEFITGETLKTTKFDKMMLAYSHDISSGYKNVVAPWEQLHVLSQKPHTHWINHHSIDGHRSEASMIPGCNMVVLDIDSGTSMQTVKLLLGEYKYLLYTTKRHTDAHHRFRLVLPLNYHVTLDEQEFKDFMSNIYEWLPISADTATGQRSRKWLTCTGSYEYNEGDQVLDAMLFIPNTAKNDERQQIVQTYQSLNNLERWFVQNSKHGNRNNQLIRYALMLVDMGNTIDQIRNNVLAMNDKLDNKLPETEIDKTIMITANKALLKRGSV